MHHPHSRAQRRHNRAVIVSRRRAKIRTLVLIFDRSQPFTPDDNSAWYRCAKWNLVCSCHRCRAFRRLVDGRKPREVFKHGIIDHLRSWQEEF